MGRIRKVTILPAPEWDGAFIGLEEPVKI